MQIDMQQFHAVFFEEAAEHLANLEAGLLQLEHEPANLELLNSIFRAAHSIKGGSGTFGFPAIAEFTHGMETLLDRMRDGSLVASGELIGLLLKASDALALLVGAARGQITLSDDDRHAIDHLRETIEAAVHGGGPCTTASPTHAASVQEGPVEYRIDFAPGLDTFRQGLDPLLLINELSQLGEMFDIETHLDRVPPIAEFDPETCYLRWTLGLRTDQPRSAIDDVFIFVADDSRIQVETCTSESACQSQQQPGAELAVARKVATSARSTTSASDSIRVSVKKVEELINLVGELVISNSMVQQALGQIPIEQLPFLHEAMSSMERTTRQLQDQVMAVRMTPISAVFRRFPRLLRDLAAALGKEVAVEISGEDTELDKQVVEEIGDPLTHLVRNAIDHGIEPKAERLAAGKSLEGQIRLAAYHEGGNVIIEISDDGRGLDPERILRKAIAHGLVSEADRLTEEQIYDLIFHPGLSTAEQVTDVSGRGVGMDVVKRNVAALNGTIAISSRRGEGTTFRIKLPLTMAILDGLSVRLGNDIYIVPMLSVVESLRPLPRDVQSVVGRGEVIRVRGEMLALYRLHDLFHAQADCTDPCQGLVVIVEHQGRKIGLLVDELLGQLQVVMKSLEANYRRVDGISGATILGDGRVAFILDLAGLVGLAR